MASDGIDEVALCGKVGQLIKKTEALLRNKEISMELNEVLDSYLGELNEKQLYLANGIANVDFPQAGIFIQNAVNVLSKEIDILWDENLQFHLKLCAHSKSTEEKQLEESKVIERINQKRRRKILTQTKDINSHLNHDISSVVSKADDILKKCSQVRNCNNLQDLWKSVVAMDENLNTSNVHLTNSGVITPESEYSFTINSAVCDTQTKEKICNYNDLYSNLATFSNCDKKFTNNDDLLQKYLQKKNLTYAEFTKQNLARHFRTWKQQEHFNNLNVSQDIQRLCSKTSVVHLSRLPDSLMNKFLRRSLSAVDECNNALQQETNQPTQLKTTSEYVSDADSLFHDGPFGSSDDEHQQNISSTRRSITDSGIFSNEEYLMEDHGHSEEFTPISVVSENVEVCESQVVPIEDDVSASSDETVEAITESNINKSKQTIQDDDPVFFQNRKSNRKFRDEEDEDEPLVKRRKTRFRKKIMLGNFEEFYRKHYIPTDGENDFFTYEESNEDIATVCSRNEDSGICQMDALDDQLSVDIANVENRIETDFPSPVEATVCSRNEDSGICQMDALDDQLSVDVANVENRIESDFPSPVEASTSFPISRSTPIPEESETFSPTLPQVSNYEEETTNRIKAVSDWQKFIAPKLIEAEEKLDFNIHEYGSNIMNSMILSEQTLFKNVVQGKQVTEVTRHFLAMLQLANTGNIEIITSNSGELANDTMELKLLTRERYHEHLNEFEAPSENSFRENLARIQALHPNFQSHSTSLRSNIHRNRN